jgi:hypothetical protein
MEARSLASGKNDPLQCLVLLVLSGAFRALLMWVGA